MIVRFDEEPKSRDEVAADVNAEAEKWTTVAETHAGCLGGAS